MVSLWSEQKEEQWQGEITKKVEDFQPIFIYFLFFDYFHNFFLSIAAILDSLGFSLMWWRHFISFKLNVFIFFFYET